MPLDPKKLGPYYTPSTTGQNTAQLINLYNQPTTIETSGTTEITTTYPMPANTMQTIGNIIEMTYWGQSFGNPSVDTTIKFTIFGTEILAQSMGPGNKVFLIKIHIIRSATDSVKWIYQTNIFNSIINGLGTITGINFATINNLTTAIQAAIDGNIRITAGYINLIQ